MSVFRRFSVTDKSGTIYQEYLARNLNVERTPQARQQIIEGTFQRSDESRHRSVRPFFYMDQPRKSVMYVLPRHERYRWKYWSTRLQAGLDLFPKGTLDSGVNPRVVFGLDELREKLILQDAGLDDAYTEYLKVLVLNDHPFLLQRPRMNLFVDYANEDEIGFVAVFDHDDSRFFARLRWESVTDIDIDTAKSWADTRHSDNLFTLPESGDYWVNFRRWAPATRALQLLDSFAEKLEAGGQIDFASRDFQLALKYLPRGNQLPSRAKRQLRIVQRYAKGKARSDIEDALFEIRFKFQLEDDWASNDDPDDIDTLWDLLKDLPDSNVEGNTSIAEILVDNQKSGGWYDPRTHEIGIGESELPRGEEFDKVVRHEVGHAVHDQRGELIDDFLKSQFGWQVFDKSNSGIDEWVGLMGGWGSLSPSDQQLVRRIIRYGLGDGKWNGNPIVLPEDHIWNTADFGPRRAFEGSIKDGRYWWENHAHWYQHGNRAFSFNFYYKTLMVVNSDTITLLGKLPDAYAAMSPAEFFAELYAAYHDLDADISFLPDFVQKWFVDNIGGRGEERD
ncbi:CpXC domain-containing protein [Endothiovibrio diazotrophicus]